MMTVDQVHGLSRLLIERDALKSLLADPSVRLRAAGNEGSGIAFDPETSRAMLDGRLAVIEVMLGQAEIVS